MYGSRIFSQLKNILIWQMFSKILDNKIAYLADMFGNLVELELGALYLRVPKHCFAGNTLAVCSFKHVAISEKRALSLKKKLEQK